MSQKAKVPAADQTLGILRLLSGSRGPLPASMIATQLDLPRSTVYHLLATLESHGFVMHLADERRYGLGIAAMELSSAYARQAPLARLGRPIIAALVDRLGMSGHLSVPHGNDVLYLVEERAKGASTLVSDVDVRLPMQLTASGRAILAALPRAQVRALFPNQQSFVHRHADHEIDRYSKLRTLLDATLTAGFASERGSVTPGFSSVAAPVLDHRAWPVAAIAVTFPENESADSRVPDAELQRIAAQVRLAAESLSARIHGPGRE